jgi:hypothetical protein
MANPTDTEVRELKDLIIANNTALTNSIASLSQRMEVGFAEVKGEMKALDQRIASVDQKFVALNDRLKNQDTKFWTLVTIILGSLSTLLIRLLAFPTPPTP